MQPDAANKREYEEIEKKWESRACPYSKASGIFSPRNRLILLVKFLGNGFTNIRFIIMHFRPIGKYVQFVF
jgi:hypothetical protein